MPMTREEFAFTLKDKYPQYRELPNDDLVQRVLARYPQYGAEIVEGGDDAAPAPSAALPASEDSMAGRFARAIPGGVGSGLMSMVDPRTYAGAARTAYNAIAKPAQVPGMIADTARGLYETATESPESAGRLTGELATSAIPFGGIVGKAKLAERAAKVLGYSREGRIKNIARAVSAESTDVPAITRLEPEIDLPVTTHAGLDRALKRRTATAQQGVEAAEANLPVTDIPIGDITSKIDSPETAIQRMMPVGPAQVAPMQVGITSDPQLANAVRSRRSALTDMAGLEQSLPSNAVVELKRQAQGAAARGKGYDRTLPGDDASASAEASMREAKALRQVLKDLPGPEAAALTKANLAAETAHTLYEPIAHESARRTARPMHTAVSETLLGRAIVPSLVGATAGFAGSGLSATGALTGLAIGRFLQSPVWNTFQAATKKRLLGILESGDISAFQNEVAKVAFAEGVASRERNRRAQRALRDQAEGVVAP